ncbi:MAG: hypothetical protein ACLFV7_14870 [Phycisphaerae bacterium]
MAGSERMKLGVLLAVCLLAAGGCAEWETTPGRSRDLGNVSYEHAYTTAREVFVAHFPIAEEDPATGVIVSRPASANEPGERLLGDSPARHVATLRLRRQDSGVVVHLSIAIERKGGHVYHRGVLERENYSGRPGRTPAETDAAIDPEQDDDWQVYGYDHRRESVILAEIYRALHAPAARAP